MDIKELVKVGALELTSNNIICSACLVKRAVIYKCGTEISRSTALRDKLMCTACGKPLVQHKAEKTVKNKK